MEISFDPAKRDATLRERALDFASASEVFAGVVVDIPDRRIDYGEDRIRTVGRLGRMVIIVWTPVGSGRRIISMRKVNEREQARYRERLG